MPFCMNCGAKVQDGAKFCVECGTSMNTVSETKSNMQDIVANRSQVGQASVGSITIGDQTITCPICGNIIASDNRSVICFECGVKFCETCESYFRGKRERGEIPLCRKCFAENQGKLEQDKLRRKTEEEERRKDLASQPPEVGEIWPSPSGIEFAVIPAGRFVMGSTEVNGATPHDVTISKPFCLGIYPVTQAQWEKVMGNNPSHFKDPRRPVEMISWDECNDFIRRLNKNEGTDRYRLPSEAEWEYACRAGSTTRFCYGDGAGSLASYAWYGENSGSETHPVGEKFANDWGFHDMYGNVWEWVADVWHENYEGHPGTEVPRDGDSNRRVYRGGSYGRGASRMMSASRRKRPAHKRYDHVGFRIAMSF